MLKGHLPRVIYHHKILVYENYLHIYKHTQMTEFQSMRARERERGGGRERDLRRNPRAAAPWSHFSRDKWFQATRIESETRREARSPILSKSAPVRARAHVSPHHPDTTPASSRVFRARADRRLCISDATSSEPVRFRNASVTAAAASAASARAVSFLGA